MNRLSCIVFTIISVAFFSALASAQVIDCACDSEYSVGDRVVALVDNPSGAVNLPAGTLGTVLCGDADAWDLYISWDNYTDGHNNTSLCDCQSGDDDLDYSHRLVLCEEVARIDADGVLNVPGEYGTIAEAIATAYDGDTIQIAAGTYNESDIEFDKSITISGAVDGSGLPATIIDGSGGSSALSIITFSSSNGNATSTFENLYFTGGYNVVTDGGALAIYVGGATVTNCTFQGNCVENGSGGGLDAGGLALPFVMSDCRFLENCADEYGGGAHVWGADITITDCSFTLNGASIHGGGLHADGGNSVQYIQGCIFQNNSADENGGGVNVYSYSTVTMDDCLVTGNVTLNGSGGGIFHNSGASTTLTILNSTVCDNTPDAIVGDYVDGGGNAIFDGYCPDDDGTLNVPGEYGTIAEAIATAYDGDTIQIAAGTYNESDIEFDKSITISGAVDGSGLPATIIDGSGGSSALSIITFSSSNGNATSTFENLYFTGGYNVVTDGGALAIYVGGATVTNCTFQGNCVENGSGGGLDAGGLALPFVMSDCRFLENCADEYGGGAHVWGADITITDCSFTLNGASIHGGGLHADGGNSVQYIQGCIFQNNSADENGGGVNVYSYSTVTMDDCLVTGNVTLNGSGGGIFHNSGASTTLTILNSTVCDNTPDAIVGDYVDGGGNTIFDGSCPDDDGTLNVPGEYGTIAEAIATAYDGDTIQIAAGTYNESGIDLNGKNITISGAVDGGGSPAVTIDAQFTDTVIYCNSDAHFENLVITGGSADDGGGMHVSGGNPTLTNCTLTNNTAKNGGGMYNTASSPSLINCTISNNGALFWQEPDTGRGGGICNVGSAPLLANTVLSGNSATWGGAICNTEASTSSLVGCTVSSNIGKVSGGGIYSVLSSASLQDTAFCANSPTHLIGAWDDLGGNTFSDDCEGVPGFCLGDTNIDYNVDILDLLYVIAVWNTDNAAGDINEDGWVDILDLLEVLSNWGQCNEA